jgi:hypothetical protein
MAGQAGTAHIIPLLLARPENGTRFLMARNYNMCRFMCIKEFTLRRRGSPAFQKGVVERAHICNPEWFISGFSGLKTCEGSILYVPAQHEKQENHFVISVTRHSQICNRHPQQ